MKAKRRKRNKTKQMRNARERQHGMCKPPGGYDKLWLLIINYGERTSTSALALGYPVLGPSRHVRAYKCMRACMVTTKPAPDTFYITHIHYTLHTNSIHYIPTLYTMHYTLHTNTIHYTLYTTYQQYTLYTNSIHYIPTLYTTYYIPTVYTIHYTLHTNSIHYTPTVYTINTYQE